MGLAAMEDMEPGGNCCFNGNEINALKPDGTPLLPDPLPVTADSVHKMLLTNDMENGDYGRSHENVRVYTVGYGTADSRYLERLALDGKCLDHPLYNSNFYWDQIPHCKDLDTLYNGGASMFPSGDLASLVTAISSTLSSLKIKWIK